MTKKEQGFTLVELIVVLGVIGVLMAMVLVAINPLRVIQDTRDTRNRAELNQIKTALQLYFNDNNSYPVGGCSGAACVGTTLSVLVPDYARALPSVVSDETSFSYTGSATDYDAGATLNNPTGDDANTVTKCSPPAVGNFMVCPD